MREQKQENFRRIVIWLLAIVGVSIIAALDTFLILLVTDSIFSQKGAWQTDVQFNSGFVKRINWTFAAFVFVISFAVISIITYVSGLKGKERDAQIVTDLQKDAFKRGSNAEAFGEVNSFSSSFVVDGIKYDGSFNIEVVPKRPSPMRFCVANVSFQVASTDESFYIEEIKRLFNSRPDNYSISEFSTKNATKLLDEKFEYSYSNYRFFNEFISDPEISKDLMSLSNDYETRIKFTLRDKVFSIEFRKQTSSDEERSQKESSRILMRLYARAAKYNLRFRQIGTIDG